MSPSTPVSNNPAKFRPTLRAYIADTRNGPPEATAMGGIPVYPTPVDFDFTTGRPAKPAKPTEPARLGKANKALTVQLDVDALEQNKALDGTAGDKIRRQQAITDEAPGAVAARAPLHFALGISKANAGKVAKALRLPSDARLGHLGQVDVVFRNPSRATPAAARACVAKNLVAAGFQPSRAAALANVWEHVTQSMIAVAL